MKEFKYLILDEVHERDIDSDFIMISVKHFLADHPDVKLILMSATINATLFAEYFSVKQINSMKEKDQYYQ
jgi:HrpA-like RNA helicase